MADDIPEWAVGEVLKRCSISPDQKRFSLWRDGTYAKAVKLFAAHIAEYEEPPVDPLLVEARKIAAEAVEEAAADKGSTWRWVKPEEYRNGGKDHEPGVKAIITALKRGIELAKLGEAQ